MYWKHCTLLIRAGAIMTELHARGCDPNTDVWSWGADAGKALAGVTNARIRGEDPSAAKLLSLVCLCITSPEQHGTGEYWGASHAPGSAQLSQNIRLAIFGNALQLVVEDLLTGSSKVRPRGRATKIMRCVLSCLRCDIRANVCISLSQRL